MNYNFRRIIDLVGNTLVVGLLVGMPVYLINEVKRTEYENYQSIKEKNFPNTPIETDEEFAKRTLQQWKSHEANLADDQFYREGVLTFTGQRNEQNANLLKNALADKASLRQVVQEVRGY